MLVNNWGRVNREEETDDVVKRVLNPRENEGDAFYNTNREGPATHNRADLLRQ